MVYFTTLRPIGPGQCIYCQEELGILTEEHVVPSGLGGWRTLPSASCERCRLITHEFETVALRHVLGPGRYWLGIRSRKKKKRPDFWPAYKRSDSGPDQKILIPLSELPFFLCMPTYAMKESMREVIPAGHIAEDVDGGVIISEIPASLTAKLAMHGADYLSPKLNHLAFARMLAKIALGYCVTEFGRDKFTSAVTPLILGNVKGYRDIISSSHAPVIEEYAGNLLEQRYEHQILHKINQEGMVCVRIDLFKNFDAPSYYVLAGVIGGVTLRFGAVQDF